TMKQNNTGTRPSPQRAAAPVTGRPVKKQYRASGYSAGTMHDEVASLKEAAQIIQRIRVSAQRELELTRKLRADAQRYQRETATRARSEAQQLILKARLSTQRDIEEFVRKASEEIQKVLADIRVIRITAQEELAAQRKFTDAARLCSMTLDLAESEEKTVVKRKKQLAASK
ncbi:MAG: hypothetical protein MUO19_08665, partial [Dehalococcoidales bacterium]|nr:hypothetical protein [Dehalococcoidales bacterium]